MSEKNDDMLWAIYNVLVYGERQPEKCNYPIPYGDDNTGTHPRSVFIDSMCARYAGGKEME